MVLSCFRGCTSICQLLFWMFMQSSVALTLPSSFKPLKVQPSIYYGSIPWLLWNRIKSTLEVAMEILGLVYCVAEGTFLHQIREKLSLLEAFSRLIIVLSWLTRGKSQFCSQNGKMQYCCAKNDNFERAILILGSVVNPRTEFWGPLTIEL